MSFDLVPIVLDCGSYMTRFGFAGDNQPHELPTVIGHVKKDAKELFPRHLRSFVGKEALDLKALVNLKYPGMHRCLTEVDWDDLATIWRHVLVNELNAEPNHHALLYTEALPNPICNREKITQLMFEEFGVPALCLVPKPVMGLYSYDIKTGLVVDSGEIMTQAVPISNLKVIQGVKSLDIGGYSLTRCFQDILSQCWYNKIVKSCEHNLVRDIKNEVCFIARKFDNEMAKTKSSSYRKTTYHLPNEQQIYLGTEPFQCLEALFKPSLLNINSDGIPHMVFKSIEACSSNLRTVMRQNVVLSGGNTDCKGFVDRLMTDLSELYRDPSLKIHVAGLKSRQHCTWLGGSKFAGNSTSLNYFIKCQDYEERGSNVVHKKRFNYFTQQ